MPEPTFINGTLNPQRVTDVAMECLYRPEEIADPHVAPDGAILAPVIMTTFGFHPERLEAARPEVTQMLAEMAPEFHTVGGGGGWSFLNLCVDKHGELWTGEHRVMDTLLALGIGLGLAKIQIPREHWGMFPRGMPYISITLPPT